MYFRSLIQTLTIAMVLGFVHPCYSSDSTAPGCAIDFNVETHNFEPDLSRQDINSWTYVSAGQFIWVGVVAQNVSNIKLYQVKLSYPQEYFRFVEGSKNYEDQSSPRFNLLIKNNGEMLWMTPTEEIKGCITLANTLTGKPDENVAPEGSGFLGFLKFKVLKDVSNQRMTLSEVIYQDIYENNISVKNLVHGVINFDIDGSKKLDLPDVISIMKSLAE